MADLISDLKVNDIIKFKSKSASDPTEYYGKVISIGNYESVIGFGDIFAYNNNVKTIYSETPDVEDCEFLCIKLLEQDQLGTPKYKIAFAKEWIEPSSFLIVNVFSRVDITIYNATEEDAVDIIAILREAGKTAKINKIY